MRPLARLFGITLIGLWTVQVQAEGGPDPEAVARLVSEIRDHGCLLTAQTATEILSRAKISEEDAAIALGRLVDEGQANPIPEGGWRLSEALCAG